MMVRGIFEALVAVGSCCKCYVNSLYDALWPKECSLVTVRSIGNTVKYPDEGGSTGDGVGELLEL